VSFFLIHEEHPLTDSAQQVTVRSSEKMYFLETASDVSLNVQRMTRNKDVYRTLGVVALYAQMSDLFPPEETILRLMLPELRTARMLDLGVGAGRTALHFAKHVREYVGADYSESMIRECQRRFASYPHPLSFVVCDARSLSMFANESFDFILFSFNGIDYVNHADRLTILKEIRRVGKAGGWFCFGTHNLNFCAQLFELRRIISLNPKFASRTARKLKLRFAHNWRVRAATVRRAPYMLINDGSHSHRLLTYYVRPEEQLRQLTEDFANIRVFSSVSGSEIIGESEFASIPDAWLYYLCTIR
jgi:SAM-dependent methyltransferase